MHSAALQPSEALLQYFKACSEDVTGAVIKRVQELSATLFPMPQGPTGVACMQSAMARERKLEVCKPPSTFPFPAAGSDALPWKDCHPSYPCCLHCRTAIPTPLP